MQRPAQLTSNILTHGDVVGGGDSSSMFIWMTSGGIHRASQVAQW